MTAPASPVGQRRRRFSNSEDLALTRLVRQWGTDSWDDAAAGIPGRTSRQCRERWKHYLSGHREVPWTAEDDDFIWDKVAEIGQRWTQIGALVSNRTDVKVRAKWKYLYKKRHHASFRLACNERGCRSALSIGRQRAKEDHADCTIGAGKLCEFGTEWHWDRNDIPGEDQAFG
jgi:hypothetical protein